MAIVSFFPSQKRGFIRILEVMIAITLLSGVVLYVIASQQAPPVAVEDYVYNYQKEVLSEITTNPLLRVMVYEGNEQNLESEARRIIPENLNFSISVCEINEQSCNLDNGIFTNIREQEIYVLDTFLASDGVGTHEHKKIRLFVWEQR